MDSTSRPDADVGLPSRTLSAPMVRGYGCGTQRKKTRETYRSGAHLDGLGIGGSVNQTRAHGDRNRFSSSGHPELGEHNAEIRLDGGLGDAKFTGDLSVALPPGHTL